MLKKIRSHTITVEFPALTANISVRSQNYIEFCIIIVIIIIINSSSSSSITLSIIIQFQWIPREWARPSGMVYCTIRMIPTWWSPLVRNGWLDIVLTWNYAYRTLLKLISAFTQYTWCVELYCHRNSAWTYTYVDKSTWPTWNFAMTLNNRPSCKDLFHSLKLFYLSCLMMKVDDRKLWSE